MIAYTREIYTPSRNIGRRWRGVRYHFLDRESGLSGEVIKQPGSPWLASIPGSSSAHGLTRDEAVRRVLNQAVSGDQPRP